MSYVDGICQAAHNFRTARGTFGHMGNQEQTLREVVGENVRRIREAVGARQDDVAAAARGWGLRWTRSKIAALERGEKALDLAEIVVLAQAMGEVAGHPVAVADLLAGDGAVRLSSALVLHRGSLRRFVGGNPVEVLSGDIPGGPERVEAVMARMPAALARAAAMAGDDTSVALILHAEEHAGEAEERVARTLGVSKMDVAHLAVGLWGRTLAEERDQRVGDDVPVASRSAKRGRATRQLVEELRARLAEVDDGER